MIYVIIKRTCIALTFLGVFIWIASAGRESMASDSLQSSPAIEFKLAIPKDKIGKYIGAVSAFSEDNGFESIVSNSSPRAEDIIFQMNRSDIKIIGVRTAGDGGDKISYDIFIYNHSYLTNEKESSKVIDIVLNKLIAAFEEIEGSEIVFRE